MFFIRSIEVFHVASGTARALRIPKRRKVRFDESNDDSKGSRINVDEGARDRARRPSQ
jgi:hypothetical protein